MSALKDKKIILGITGGIAAYKSPDIVRRLREKGAVVQVVMTAQAKEFITPLTLQAVSGYPVRESLFDLEAEAAMGHIELARWADLILIAPATAHFIASLASGMAYDLLTTLCLATQAKIMIAPAMNQQMWQHAATKANCAKIQKLGYQLFEPDVGFQACGDIGPGRLLESTALVAALENSFTSGVLSNIKVLITAGPTMEPIDPVRFISNYSSGKMGYALAIAAKALGATVTLISGPVHLPEPIGIKTIFVTTAEQMLTQVMLYFKEQDIFIAAAAVVDYHVKDPKKQKIKKIDKKITLELEKNLDILTEVTRLQKPRPFVVGFAAETENLLQHAKEKLIQKGLDMIVANEVAKPDRGFCADQNAATVLWREGERNFPLMSKQQLASELITIIAAHYEKRSTENS